MASASVGSPAASAGCQASTGSWLTTSVERTWLRSSITSNKQRVGRAEAAWLAGWWTRSGKSSFFEPQVGVEVDLCRLEVLVAEPECDHRCVDVGVQQLHCGGVPEDVCRDPFGL
jgi:hypothetical protein